MTGPLRAGPLTVLDDVAVVFDDQSRVRWSRQGGDRWLLAELWPNREELAAVEAHLGTGGCMLVITDGQPIRTYALRTEVPAATRESTDSEVIEIRVPHFDWLPGAVRRRGEQFLREQHQLWAGMPSLLRPPVVIDSAHDQPLMVGQVTLALSAPGVSRGRWEREIVDYLAFLRGADRTVRPLA